jgi:kynurenine formamidase
MTSIRGGRAASVVLAFLLLGVGLGGGALCAGCAGPPPEPIGLPTGRVVDLTHPFDEETIYWPTEGGFVLEAEFHGETEKGYWYESNHFRAAEHGGTHIDAPVHFHRGGRTVDEVPVADLLRPAVMVDAREACAADRDHRIGVDELRAWEAEHGRIPPGAIVLLRTGFGPRWPDRESYLGTAERGPEAVAKLHFPGLHPDAAIWLAEERDIRAVGIDTASIDYGQSTLYETHVALFARNVPALENVANLDALPPRGFTVVALPMKIGGGSGGPLRIVAIVP